MFRPRWYKVFSDLWGNKIRSLLVIASITVGLFAVGLIVSMQSILLEDMETGYRATNPATLVVNASPFDEEIVKSIRSVVGVHQAEGARSLSLRVRDVGGHWIPIEIRAFQDLDEKAINTFHLEAGTWPPEDETIAIDRSKLGELPAGPGGELELELPSGKVRRIPVAGVVHDQSIGATDPGGFFLAPVQGYVTLETLDWLEATQEMNLLYLTLEGDDTDLGQMREVANRVGDKLEEGGLLVFSKYVRAADDHPNRVYVQAIGAVLVLLGFLVMFLSAFLITNTLSALLNQQLNQIGVMKTIGATRGQIMGIYMLLIFLFSMAAFWIALPLSSQAAYALLEFLAGQINMVLQGYRMVPLAAILQLAIALIVPQAAGFLPIWSGTSVSAVEALNGSAAAAPAPAGTGRGRRLQPLRRLPRPLLLSLRNTFRRKGRLALTLFTLTLGGAIFIGTFNVQRSLSNYVDRISRYFLADVNLTMENNYRISEMDAILKGVPGVLGVEAWASAAGELIMPDDTKGESVSLLAPPADSPLVDPVLLEGRWVTAGDEAAIAVNERFRELFPDLQVGGTLRMKINGDEEELQVVGFFQLAGKSGGYLAYTTYEYLADLIHERNRANTFRVTSSRPELTLGEQEELGRRIEAHLEALGFQVADVEAGHSLTANTADGLNTLTSFLLIMASLIAIVGSIGLTGTMSMNVLERTREIGISRAIGASNGALMTQVIVEGLLIGLMSWLFGTLLAFPISTVMSNAINLSLFGARASFTFTPIGVGLWLVLVLVLAVLASVMPARNAARLTIREVLAYE